MLKFALALVSAVLLMSCVTGYTPPIKPARGPASAPSVAIESGWQEQPAHTYPSSTGRMYKVLTNSTIGGTMFFEVVPSEHQSRAAFAMAACSNLADSESAGCGTVIYDEAPAGGAMVFFQLHQVNKEGVIIVRKMLGQSSRYMVCSGSWATYGDSAAKRLQNNNALARLRQMCDLLSMR